VGAVALAAILSSVATASAQQEWLLNGTASRFYMQTAKANAIIETHQFTGLDGGVTKDGDATFKIDLISVASGIDVRDVRMRFLLFETFKFPQAEVTAKLDMSKLQELVSTTRINYPLKFTLNLHGVVREVETPVFITRLSDKSIAVTSAKPIIVTGESHALVAGIAKLSEAVGGTPIVTAASITFDLVFETGEKIPEIEMARTEAAKRRTAEETSAISTEACETRFSVISTTQAIYFKSGSAELDHASEPLLNSVAEIASRCPAAKIEVTGHTDALGSKEGNRQLSESRARSVVSYLGQRGIPAARVESSGYGDTRPIGPNDTEANRAKNRRIEFRVKAR
jgi:outer membrane protein OmpA-like peptidoglycan-associated protein/polyisoprenoid-binding protein YceI